MHSLNQIPKFFRILRSAPQQPLDGRKKLRPIADIDEEMPMSVLPETFENRAKHQTIRMPALNRGVRVLWRKDGSLAAGRSLRFTNFRGLMVEAVHWVLTHVDGLTPRDELQAQLRDYFPDARADSLDAAYLAAERSGLIHERQVEKLTSTDLSETSLDRFDRQLNFWAQYEEQRGLSRWEMQSRLEGSTVLQIGLGGLGSWIAYGLISSGISKFVASDRDVVDLSNLNRQILYSTRDVGSPKIDAAQRRLTEYYPQLEFTALDDAATGEEQIRRWLNEYNADFAVLAADHPEGYLRRWFSKACVDTGTPHLLIGGTLLGPFVVPGKTPCFGCYEQTLRSADADYDHFIDQLAGQPPERSSVAFRHSIMSGHIVREIVMFLSGAGDPLSAGSVIRVDTDRISSRSLPIIRDAQCKICSTK